jgi:cellulose synthase/poly-beta-1,6-N-acetylglucosamine synthase-like glycosyltransferase
MELLPDFDTFPDNILFFTFAFIAILHLLFVFLIHGKLAFYKEHKTLPDEHLPGVSIIISARNEADNLFENLPLILEQNYPEFEVIVINHQSVDETAHLLSAYQRRYPHLHVIEVARNHHLRPGKKLPITLGVKGARFEYLLLTDADCKPAGTNWLKSMASRFIAGKEIVLGYGPHTKKKGFLNRVIRFDTAWIAVNYFSMALARLPYMGVGRNLAYTKDVFIHVHGFKSHYSLPSGDDDLFIQEAAKKKNYTINLSSDSYTYSDSSDSWGQWKRQKTRHYTTSSRYNVIKKWLLGIYPLTLLILFISFVILMFSTEFRFIAIAVFGVIVLLKWWIQGRCLNKIGEKAFIAFLPVWDLFYAVLIPFLYFSGEKKRMKRW